MFQARKVQMWPMVTLALCNWRAFVSQIRQSLRNGTRDFFMIAKRMRRNFYSMHIVIIKELDTKTSLARVL